MTKEKSTIKFLIIFIVLFLCSTIFLVSCNKQNDSNLSGNDEFEVVPINTEITRPINDKFYKIIVTNVNIETIWSTYSEDIVFTIDFYNPDSLGIYSSLLYFDFYIEDLSTFQFQMFNEEDSKYSNPLDNFTIKAKAITTIKVVASVNMYNHRDIKRLDKKIQLSYLGTTIFSKPNTETI